MKLTATTASPQPCSWHFWALSLFALICLGGFVTQVKDQVDKYLKQQTTMVFETRRPDDGLGFPVVALCPEPHFNYDAMAAHGIPIHQWMAREKIMFNESLWNAPSSREEIDKWHTLSTYSLDEVLPNIEWAIGEEASYEDIKVNEDAVSVTTVPALTHGVCFVLRFHWKAKTLGTYIIIRMTFPENVTAIKAHIAMPGEEITGVTYEYWIGEVKVFRLVPDTDTNIAIVEKTRLLKPEGAGNCAVQGKDKFDCISERIKENVTADVEEDGLLCYWPTYRKVTKKIALLLLSLIVVVLLTGFGLATCQQSVLL